MIDNKEDLANAIALNSSMFNGARLVGPALAAALLTHHQCRPSAFWPTASAIWR